jgi:hypothetical protein
MTNIRTNLVAAGALLAAVCFSTTSSAQLFAPINCSASTWTNVAFTYQVGGGSGVWELPTDPANPSNYINNLYSRRWIIGNQYIADVQIEFDGFSTEAGHDFFSYNRVGYGTISLSGTFSTPSWKTANVPGLSLQDSPLYTIFNSDSVNTSTGFSIAAAKVICGVQDNNVGGGLRENDRNCGILLGQNDTVYTSYHPWNNTNDITVALWPNAPGVNDIDLYVRCDALPTVTQYDYAGLSYDAQEFVHIPAGQCPYGHTLYIAVNAFDQSFAASFNLTVQNHDPGYHFAGVIARTEFNATAEEMGLWSDTLQKGARRFFGAAEGTFYMTNVDVRNNTGSGEAFQLNNYSDRADVDVCYIPLGCDRRIHLFTDDINAPLTVAHEMGHYFGILADEYDDDNGSHCGHSIMGNYYESPMNNNFCYCGNWNEGTNHCDASRGDHSKDGDVGSSEEPVWSVLVSAPYVNVPDATPDNYNYENFDFNGLVAKVNCAHSTCTSGSYLVPACDPCVRYICLPGFDPYCCNVAWDSQCVGEMSSICDSDICG